LRLYYGNALWHYTILYRYKGRVISTVQISADNFIWCAMHTQMQQEKQKYEIGSADVYKDYCRYLLGAGYYWINR